jgi:hypothetical protein
MAYAGFQDAYGFDTGKDSNRLQILDCRLQIWELVKPNPINNQQSKNLGSAIHQRPLTFPR